MGFDVTLPNNWASLGPQSYSGMGQGWTNWSQNTAQPVLSNLLNNYNSTVNSNYAGASNGIGQFAQTQMQPAVQNTLNTLNANGVLNSSVAGDALSKTMLGVASNAQGLNANMETGRVNALNQLPALTTNAAQLGQYSNQSDPWAPYASILGFINNR